MVVEAGKATVSLAYFPVISGTEPLVAPLTLKFIRLGSLSHWA